MGWGMCALGMGRCAQNVWRGCASGVGGGCTSSSSPAWVTQICLNRQFSTGKRIYAGNAVPRSCALPLRAKLSHTRTDDVPEPRAKPSPSVFTADITKRGEADFSPFPFARKRYFVFSIRASCTTMTYAQPRFKHIRGITQSALHADSARAARYRAFAYALISL